MDGSVPVEHEVNAGIPEPPGLLAVLRDLEHWSNEAPCEEAFLNLLLVELGLGEKEKAEFQAGSSHLLEGGVSDYEEAIGAGDLVPAALIALALALVVRGEHGLRRYPKTPGARQPEVLREVERMARRIVQALEELGRAGKRGSLGHLNELRSRLQEHRAVVVSGASLNEDRVREKTEEIEARVKEQALQKAEEERSQKVQEAKEAEAMEESRKREAAEEERALLEVEAQREAEKAEERLALERAEAEATERRRLEKEQAERAAASEASRSFAGAVSVRRVFFGVFAGVILLILALILPKPGGSLPPASSYSEVPTLGLIRHRDVVVVRIKSAWFQLPAGQRTTAARALWKRLQEEGGGEPMRLELADQTGKQRGWVASGRVRWGAR